MTIATYKGEKTISELAGRVFEMKSTKSKELAAAEAALLKVNPRLASLHDLAPGDLILVPPMTGAGSSREASPESALVSGFVKDLGPLLGDFRKRLDAAASRESDDLSRTLSTLKEREFVQEAGKMPDLNERLEAVLRDVKARQGRIKEEQAATEKILARIEGDLAVRGRTSSKADALEAKTPKRAGPLGKPGADAGVTG